MYGKVEELIKKGRNEKNTLDVYEWKKQYLIRVRVLRKTKFLFT